MTTVLIVDDEPQILRALRINLSARGYNVVTAATGAGALRAAADRKPDIVILDLGLPDIDGVQVLHGLRGWLRAPVIVLSARTDSADKVGALDAGADDYVTKPFGMEEFLARLRAAVRRAAAPASNDGPLVTTASFTVDLAAKKVIRNGTDVHFTPTEWGILEMLVRNRGTPRRPHRATTRGMGHRLHRRNPLPARLPRTTAAQTRTRPRSPPTPAHRGRHGLPVPGITGPKPRRRPPQHGPAITTVIAGRPLEVKYHCHHCGASTVKQQDHW